jgi:exopolysaccharide biosynthesis polyprenyl glycosylphosphotransferase
MRRHAARKVVRVVVLAVIDVLASLAAFAVGRATDLALHQPWDNGFQPLEVGSRGATFVVVSVLLSLVVSGGYVRGSQAQGSVRLLRGASLAGALVALGMARAAVLLPMAVSFAVWTAMLWIALACGRALGERVLAVILSHARLTAPAVLVGSGGSDTVPGEEETPYSERHYHIVCSVEADWIGSGDPLPALNRLAALIDEQQVEAIVVPRRLPEGQLELLLDLCCTAGCEFLYSARAIEVAGVRPSIVWRGQEPFFEFTTPELEGQQLVLKRCLDVMGATIALLVLAPLYLAVAVAVKLDTAGPVFFSQDRAGLGGRRFRMHKFRTMEVGADTEKPNLLGLNHTGDSRLFKIPNDPRVTRVGRFLRRWSLDELPQIWNVFVGDMSLVGPRPFFASDLEDYEAHHYRRLGAKPGITGLWQVSGRSHVVDFEEVVRLDREYIENWSIWLDISILLRTIPAVLDRDGAY